MAVDTCYEYTPVEDFTNAGLQLITEPVVRSQLTAAEMSCCSGFHKTAGSSLHAQLCEYN